MECDLSKKHHPNSVLPDCVRMITDGTQTSDDLLIRPLKLAIKVCGLGVKPSCVTYVRPRCVV